MPPRRLPPTVGAQTKTATGGTTMSTKRLAGATLAIVAAVSISAAAASPAPRVTAAKASKSTLVSQLAAARIATAKYVSNLGLAKENGYGIITRMIPNMGYHYMNPKVNGFKVKKTPILLDWQT